MKKLRRNIFVCLTVAAMIAAGVGCGGGDEPLPAPEGKVEYSYSMSALTVAIGRSYARATGAESTATLPAEYLSGIPQKSELLEAADSSVSYLKGIRVTHLINFTVSGSYQDDVLNEYCGAGPYSVVIADYLTETRNMQLSGSEGDFRLTYTDSMSPTEDTVIFVTGKDGRLLTAYADSCKHNYDDVNTLLSMESTFGIGRYSKGLELTLGEQSEYSLYYKVDCLEGTYSFRTVRENASAGYTHGYTVESSDFTEYDIDDYYLVRDLTLPEWYTMPL